MKFQPSRLTFGSVSSRSSMVWNELETLRHRVAIPNLLRGIVAVAIS